MELDLIKNKTTWNDASASINSNFAKLLQAIASLGPSSGEGFNEYQLREFLTQNGYTTADWVLAQEYLKVAEANGLYAPLTGFNTLSGDFSSLKSRFDALDDALNDDTSGKINTWNEIVDFLDEYSGSEDLATILSGMNANIASRLLSSEFNSFKTDDYNAFKSATNTALSDLADADASASTAIGALQTTVSGHTTDITNLGNRVTANERNIAEFFKWFAIDDEENLYTTYNFYSTKEISANGLSIGSGGSGGGLISQVYGITAFGTIASESNSATFNAYAIDSLYKRIVSLEGKATAVSFVPALTSGKQIGTISIDGVSTALYGVDAYSKTESDGTFLKLTGGEVKGYVNFSHATQSIPLGVHSKSTDYVAIRFTGGTGNSAYLVYSGNGDEWAVTPPNWAGSRILLHSGNYNSYALPLTGGTITGGAGALEIKRNGSYLSNIKFSNTDGELGKLGFVWANNPAFFHTDGNYYSLLHAGNYSQYALPLSGGALLSSTIGCPLYLANTKEDWNVIGFKGKSHSDYAYLGLGGDGNFFVTTTGWTDTYGLIHSGNIGSFKAGGLESEYLVSLDNAGYNKVFSSGFQATNRPSENYATGLTLYNTELGYTYQLAYSTTGGIFSRYKNGTTWSAWNTLIHSGNYNSYALPLSGGTISGNITLQSTGTSRDMVFKTSVGTAWFGYQADTDRWFVTNKGWSATYFLIHSDNYNSYAPKLDGTGASGTWGIDVSGTAASLQYHTIFGLVSDSAGKWKQFAKIELSGRFSERGATFQLRIPSASTSVGASCEVYVMMYQQAAMGSAPQYSVQTNCDDRKIKIAAILNYNSTSSSITLYAYCPHAYTKITVSTLSRYGSDVSIGSEMLSELPSGTQIAIEKMGTSYSTTKLATARTIWGQSFDGSGNVSGTLYDVNNIYPNSAAERYIGTSSNPFKYVYAEWFGAATNSNLAFGANNAVHMVIKTSGNVLVGTTTDTSGNKLQVNGTILSTPARESAYSSVLRGYQSGIVAGDRLSVVIGKESTSKNAAYFGFTYDDSGSSKNFASIGFHSVDNILCVAATSYVGIGTTSPKHKLHVYGNIAADATDTTNSAVYASNSNGTVALLAATNRGVYDANADRWIICSNGTNTWLPSGNVGIGASANEYHKLYVHGSIYADGNIALSSRILAKSGVFCSYESTCGAYMEAGADGTYAGIYTCNNGAWQSSNIYLHNNGNVTINKHLNVNSSTNLKSTLSVTGAATMSSTLSVAGNINISTVGSAANNNVGYMQSGTTLMRYNGSEYGNLILSGSGGAMYFRPNGTTNTQGEMNLDGNGLLLVKNIDTADRIYTPYVFLGKNAEGIYLTYNSITWHNSSNNYQSGLFGFRYNEIIAHQSITANSGVKVASGQALTFLDASGVEHKLTYDSTAGAFKFDGNVYATQEVSANGIGTSGTIETTTNVNLSIDGLMSLAGRTDVSQSTMDIYGLTTDVVNKMLAGRYNKILGNSNTAGLWDYDCWQSNTGNATINLKQGDGISINQAIVLKQVTRGTSLVWSVIFAEI